MRISPRIRSIRDGVDKKQRVDSARSIRAGEELPSHRIPLCWLQEALAETLWAQDSSVIPVSSIQLLYPLL